MEIEHIRKINDMFVDEESKRVFASRVLYSVTGDMTHLYNLGKEFKRRVIGDVRWKEFIDFLKSIGKTNGIILYGTGGFGNKILELTPDIPWKCVIETMPSKDYFRNLPVKSIEAYKKNDGGESIVISSKRYYEEMTRCLEMQDIDKNRIIDGTVLYDLTEGSQYFDLDELPHSEGEEVFLDIGCCDGLSSVQFMKWCNGNGFCYCFEPDKENINLLKKNMKEKGMSKQMDYCLIPKGVWDKEGTISFVAIGTGSSHIDGVYGSKENHNIESIPVTAIDTLTLDKPVTFIKMDIEGAEIKALHGGKKLISEKKPKLAICVYHKTEDIWEIPMYIKQLRPDYQLYLRHYSFEASETVLYAI